MVLYIDRSTLTPHNRDAMKLKHARDSYTIVLSVMVLEAIHCNALRGCNMAGHGNTAISRSLPNVMLLGMRFPLFVKSAQADV